MNIVNQIDIDRLIGLDNRFLSIKEQYGVPPNWSRPEGFTSLARIILEQQVSLASANAHFLKLDSYLGGITPMKILSLHDDEMRYCQISRQKSKYLRALSQTIVDGVLNLDGIAGLPEIEIRKQLTKIKGIGDWTADIYLMFCLQAKDILPMGDVAIVTTIRELSDARKVEEMILLTDTWRPFRSLATYFLWHHYLNKRNRVSA